MTDHFIWYDPWAQLPTIPVRQHDDLDPAHVNRLTALARTYGHDPTARAMEALGYRPLRTCPAANRTRFLSDLERRLKTEIGVL